VPHSRDHVFFDQGGEPAPLGPLTPSSTPMDRTPFAFRPPTQTQPTPPIGPPPFVPPTFVPPPSPFAPVELPFVPIPVPNTPTFGPLTPFFIPPTPFVPQPFTPQPFTPLPLGPGTAPLLPPTTGGPVATIPGFGQPSDPSTPGFGFPGAPPGAGGFTFTPLGPIANVGCNLLPPGAARDACLVAATFLPGGQTPTFSPQGATPGGMVGPPLGTSNLQAPMVVNRRVHQCPRFANGVGILWMNAAGSVVCLPRGHNGRDIGLVRKNPKRHKAFITHAQIKQLKSVDKTKKKAKAFAKLAGLHTHKGHRSR